MAEDSRDQHVCAGESLQFSANTRERNRAACAGCGGPFGLTRRRRTGRQFCSLACVESYECKLRETAQDRARWYAFLSRRQHDPAR